MRVLGVHETVLYAADVGAAAAFYAEVLGLEPFPEALGAAGRGMRLPGGAVLLIFDPELSTRRGRGVPTHGAVGPCHVCFAIPRESYESWLARLAAKGVEVDLLPRSGRQLGRADGRGLLGACRGDSARRLSITEASVPRQHGSRTHR
jgi:catechol 2,3-dioxygenase-like lactoylglutathione lyase family enzyme